jgi:hypothetical protein
VNRTRYDRRPVTLATADVNGNGGADTATLPGGSPADSLVNGTTPEPVVSGGKYRSTITNLTGFFTGLKIFSEKSSL